MDPGKPADNPERPERAESSEEVTQPASTKTDAKTGNTDTENMHDGTQEQIEGEMQALLDEMHTSFKSFSETIFTKIDFMQVKINELENSVTNLSATTSIEQAGHEVVAPGSAPGAGSDVAPSIDP